MDPLASKENQFTAEVEDMFADTEGVAQVHELLPEDVVLAPVISTPKSSRLGNLGSSVKFWFWRWRKPLLVTVIIVTGITIIVGIVYWLKSGQSNTQVPVTINSTVPLDNSNSVIVNVAPVSANVNRPTVSNSSSDTDYDGLSDEEELLYNTNPKKKDTDEDGLSDREEVRVYATDPRNPDTDGDRYKDGEEVTHFYDPKNSDSTKRLFELLK